MGENMSERAANRDDTAFAFVTAVDGGRMVCQFDTARAAAAAVGIGSLVVTPCTRTSVVGLIYALRGGRRSEDDAFAEIQLLGYLEPGEVRPQFCRGVVEYPSLRSPVRAALPEEEQAVFAHGERPSVVVGHIRSRAASPATLLIDELLGKHFAILGSTGSGKSSAVAVLLRSLIARCPHAHILLIDPHAEYAPAFGDKARVLDARSLRLPFWLLTLEELAAVLAPGASGTAEARRAVLEDALRAARLASAPEHTLARVTVDTPLPYRLSDLEEHLRTSMGRLDRAESTAPYRGLLGRLAAIRQDPRYTFLFPRLAVSDDMQAVLADLFRFRDDGRPLTLLDTSGMASEVVDVVVSVLCRLAFEYGLWTPPERLRPLLLVCEEAHRYVPADPGLGFEPSRRAIDRLAKEGRKYGIALGLVSQRPSELSPAALSQCGTIFALRLTNDRDRAFVEHALPDGAGWIARTLPGLTTGEALVVGEAVPVPMVVRFDRLPPGERPAGATPRFAELWSQPAAGPQQLAATIERWRQEK
jgi:DNA helicase HerA-like ATPase